MTARQSASLAPDPLLESAELARQRRLLERLEQGWIAQGRKPQRFETHVSWVFVVGALAYKFKKAVRFDVLDYSTLARRHACCERELRLNRGFAPSLYLDLVAVTGDPEQPQIGGSGEALEYAVAMRAFPQQAMWSARLQAGTLERGEIDALALRLAQLHRAAAVAPSSSAWGTPARIAAAGRQDLATLTELLATGWATPAARAQADMLTRWHAERTPPAAMLARRRAERRIRACHGDLHSANILTLDGKVELFDCIEFNDALRWIDVLDDLAFVLMDLRYHGRGELAARLLGRYLEASGDYGGLVVLEYYQIMRAVARCKVWLLRAHEATAGVDAMRQNALRYLALAAAGITRRGALLLMHGYAGSGKSFCAGALAEALGGVRIRSDVERKRLKGLAASDHAASPVRLGIYDETATRATYARLLRLAASAAAAGLPVVVDAAFLQGWQRRRFAALALRLGVPYFVVDVQTTGPVMLSRLAERHEHPDDASDAGEQILAYQLMSSQPLTTEELTHTIVLDGAAAVQDSVACVAQAAGLPLA